MSPIFLALQAGGEAAPAGPNMLVLLGGMALIFYFIAIRPERKERARKQSMIEALRKNDKVLTTSGMYATVAAVNENEITIKFDDGPTRVKLLKSAIAQVLTDARPDAAEGK